MGPSKIQTRALVSSPNVLTTRLNTLFPVQFGHRHAPWPGTSSAGRDGASASGSVSTVSAVSSSAGADSWRPADPHFSFDLYEERRLTLQKLDPDPHVYDLDSHVYVRERCRRSVGRPVPNTAQRRPGPLLFHFSLICPSQLKHYVRSHSIQLRLFKLHRSPISMHFSG
ncbi:hypothetical protein BHE74_00007621 [Ensete ventricosum]|nr:hypothetical protein BHE74_00007621 [Ensete ventricosum]